MMFSEHLKRELDKLSNDGELILQVRSKCNDGMVSTKWIELNITTEELYEALVYANDNRHNIWEVI